MPRLPFWGFGAAATAGMSYAGYHFVYEPRQAAQHDEENHLTHVKQPYQDVIHAYACLRAKVEEQLRSAAWCTNADKTVFFCDVQLVRSQLWTLPRHLTTEHDLHRMLAELSLWEKQHCTELHFRDKPLLLTQTLRSMVCFALYALIFRVAAPLLGLWDGFAGGQAQLLHHTARVITNTLDIGVVMTSTEKPRLETRSAKDDTHGEGEKSAARYITLSPVHWIEEVGFWACANNPLLTQHLHNMPHSKDKHDGGGATLRLLRASPYATTYTQLWRQVAVETQADEKREAEAALASPQLSASPSSSLVHVAAEEVSLGYPVLFGNVALPTESKKHGMYCAPDVTRYIPVGVSGLPHLLYVDAAHAVADVRPRLTREEVYARRQRAQLVRASGADLMRTTKAEEEGRSQLAATVATATATAATSALTELQHWRACGGIPWWRRAWWGGVYGGSRPSVTAPSYTLRYHLGAPSTAADYVAKSIEASRAAESFSRAGL
ncbi:hypothetical protein ABB37_00241 [Leptomonas pyrrhocoris]|uniref:Uncharacterized protein n=1 Tax=Leptomonas pyrrhocoris TaxID=157538 RepID=A0A0N1J5F3_LEPPY|nr:hypothetical protein ABB37_00241 [Leptomonas pyrrhocoris]KPA85941.1 hypothetical protein ABB37_00241 [Leptomonas pyrrhocoris]|eukprot:XP_015664380.1 hypothetical protein ABB37_00241 [Leptomonas pyrrhocoris]